jgi:molybdenum cofactor cytidylyltransferase
MLLRDALRIEPGQTVAFTGAGGKTTAIRRLARELTQALVTTTTKLGRGQVDLARQHVIDPKSGELARIPQLLEQSGTVLVTGPLSDTEGKWTAPGRATLEALCRIAAETGAPLLIEADGARGRSLKAPAEHEPIVPEFTNTVVPMAGLDVLGQPIDSPGVHRPERISELLGLDPSHTVGAREIARLLGSARGGLKGVPSGAQVRILLNKADPSHLAAGREIAGQLLESPGIQAVVLASLQAEDPVMETHGRVAGIVLAAGGSTRLGQPKQLVEFRGRPLVWHAVRVGLGAGLSPLVVVSGADGEQIRQALETESVMVIDNPDWEAGQSSSVRAGLAPVEAGIEAAIFLLADMPLMDPELVRQVVKTHRVTRAPLVAPRVAGRGANPVLFDRTTFSDLHQLTGDQGGRSLFDRYEAAWVEWTESAMLDLDTPEDLQRLRDRE